MPKERKIAVWVPQPICEFLEKTDGRGSIQHYFLDSIRASLDRIGGKEARELKAQMEEIIKQGSE